MQLAGYSVCIVPESTVYHVGGGTLPSTSPFKLFLNFRNNLLMLENNLARTYALKRYREMTIQDSSSARKAAIKGMKDAQRVMMTRKLMDAMSAAVYLMTFRFNSFKSVRKAHKDFKRLSRKNDVESIAEFITTHRDSSVKGIYDKWIIFQSFRKKGMTCNDINGKDFQKI